MQFDPSQVSIEQISREHPHRAYWKFTWSNFRLLYEGGEAFLRAAGQASSTRAQNTSGATGLIDVLAQQKRRRRFLYQLEGEPDTKYISRWERAYYIGYLGAIVDYFRHNLFSQPPRIRPAAEDGKETPEPPDWHAAFLANCDGGRCSFLDFVKHSFLDALLVQQGGWLIGRPSADIGTKPSKPGEDGPGVVLTRYRPEDIFDWDVDDAGELNWIVLRKVETIREFPKDRAEAITFTYVDRDSWAAWEEEKAEDGKTSQLRFIGADQHGLDEVPFVRMQIPEGMWIANKLASWQIDLFNQLSMLSYGQLVSCFLQPTITSDEEGAANRIFGEGITVHLRNGGKDVLPEKFEWIAPDPAPLEFQAKRILEQRDEGYRIVHQMALSVDNAATNIARSGVSKIEDRRAAEVILCGYGGYVRDAMIRTLNLVSKIVGDKTKWVVAGFDNFEVSSMMEELQTASLLSTLNIQSPTFKAELQKDIAGRVLDHLDDATKAEINDEIDDAVEQEQEMANMMPPPGSVPPGSSGAPAVPGAPDRDKAATTGSPAVPPKTAPPKPKGPNA